MKLTAKLLGLCCSFLFIFALNNLPAAAQPLYLVNGKITETVEHQPYDDYKILEVDNEQYKYTDYTNGYSVRLPGSMQLDITLGAVRSVFFDDTTRIEIYYDNFTHSISNATDYVEYGNRFKFNTKDHTVTEDTYFYANGKRVHLLKWHRAKLLLLPEDKNYYASAEIIKNSQEVYTVFIKSSQPIAAERELISTFSLLSEYQGTPVNAKVNLPSKTPMNQETNAFFKKYLSIDSPQVWGIFEPSAPDYLEPLEKLETAVDYKFKVLVRYQTLEEALPLSALEKAYNQGKYVELTLQTVLPSTGAVNALIAGSSEKASQSIMYDILSGKYDAYFKKYASDLKTFAHPVLFRLNNEMNGDWCWYSAYYTGKDPLIYTAVWRYLHDLFRQNGVDNVVWVWNPHDVTRPEFKWNHYLMYYPGDEYVDVIGLTGYNTGTHFRGESWRSFNEIYAPLYDEYMTNFNKPFIIGEFAASSIGGDKPAWIEDMFRRIRNYPNIKIAIWWSGIDYDSDNRPGRIYILDETEETTAIFRENLKTFK